MFVAATMLTLGLAAPDCSPSMRRAPEAVQYFHLLELYLGGRRAEAIRGFSELHESDRLDAVRRIQSVVEASRGGEQEAWPLEDDCLVAASLLHTEMATRAVGSSDWERADADMDHAWELTTLLQSSSRQISFQRDWLLAAGLLYQTAMFHSDPFQAFTRSVRHLDEAARRYPHDTAVLVAAGAVHEWAGSLARGDSNHLERAARLYREAIVADPECVEAHFRLGRVLDLSEYFAEARSSYETVLAQAADDTLRYRAHMRLGALAERRGAADSAIEHYRVAIQLEPTWQVGHLALSHSLRRAGRRDEARRRLDVALSLELEANGSDGWWEYELGSSPQFDSLWSRIRAEAAP